MVRVGWGEGGEDAGNIAGKCLGFTEECEERIVVLERKCTSEPTLLSNPSQFQESTVKFKASEELSETISLKTSG